ncbi:C4-dicarboxylate transporter [Klebsormidium nitens]|uniref:C4-dicarboxylate transporter n=1 Tax=Klebsormidium nitens TaxID=105231 RepID=A0A1Y1HRJ9_KLENI|nr:C4-dicarboxylate transporter [Klebsormidium nitens]|eukprot:GAQ79206.1 C4-dicarboxylate transporter [Klebsormidium nitens]
MGIRANRTGDSATEKERSDDAETKGLHVSSTLDIDSIQTGTLAQERKQPPKKMPFLLRFRVTAFGMNLGIGSQTVLWQQLTTLPATRFLHIPSGIPLGIWCAGVVLLPITSVTYLLKFLIWPQAVRLEFRPIRTNFLIAPWWAALLLCLGAPGEITDRIYGPGKTIHWGVALGFTIPLLAWEILLYSRWIYACEGRLGATATAATQIAYVGNFASALAFAGAGWRDPALFMFSFGILHWVVVFTTVYMRPSESQRLPPPLGPLYLLFISPPAMAATAWSKIQGPGHFDSLSKGFAFIALGLFVVLATRAHLVLRITFSLAWWAFVFPLSTTAVAFFYYADSVTNSSQKWVVTGIALFFWALFRVLGF